MRRGGHSQASARILAQVRARALLCTYTRMHSGTDADADTDADSDTRTPGHPDTEINAHTHTHSHVCAGTRVRWCSCNSLHARGTPRQMPRHDIYYATHKPITEHYAYSKFSINNSFALSSSKHKLRNNSSEQPHRHKSYRKAGAMKHTRGDVRQTSETKDGRGGSTPKL